MSEVAAAGAPRPIGRVLTGALLGGAIAGAGAGLIDAIWSWPALEQFLIGFLGRVRLAVFLAASYALAGAIAGVLLGAVALVFTRATRLGDLLRHALATHAQIRARDPRDALVGLSLVLAGIPMVAVFLGATYTVAYQALAMRKHMGLIIAVAMAMALVALVAAVAASFLVARPLESGLRRLAGHRALAGPLSSMWAPPVAVGALVLMAGAVAATMTWETLALLHLRPATVTLVGLALAIPSVRTGGRITDYLATRRRAALRLVRVLVPLGAFGLLLWAGAPEGVRKASNAYSGLGGPLTRVYRAVLDFDRDGYSSFLGGGDCAPWDPDIHPGAVDIPDDGIDQNCVGGDLTLTRDPAEVSFAPVPASVPEGFNVVLITIDTIRADHLGAYGYQRDTSPALDALAADGTLFESGWAHAPSTRYSIPSILTGRYPLAVRYDHSIRGWPGLAEEATTIAEILKGRGFATGAILNYWYFDRQRRMDQGFDLYDNSNQRLHKGVPGEGPAHTRGSSSKEQTDKALEFVGNHADQRFFLWVHYYDPHYEYELHPEVTVFGTSKIDLYDNEILFTDLHIGRLIDDLKRRGLYDRTVFVVTGDHGEGFGEHGIYLHGYHLYAAQTKVPLIVRVPGVEPRVATTPAGHVDILPTLANLAGAAPTPEMMGRSLVDIITGQAPADADRIVFQELSYENNNEMRAAVSKQCHVIFNVSPHTSWELYRIDIDPDETRDVIDRPGPCAPVREALELWYDRSQIPPGAAEALLPGPPELDGARPVDFGDEVRLLSVEVPDQVRPGQGFEVTYTFEARGRLDPGWKIFAHFEGDRGGRFLGDHQPPRPFEWWSEGQYIRYRQPVTVPPGSPPGTYHMWIGIYRGNQRRPVRSGSVAVKDQRADVAQVRVVR
jgi:arylsulfatase A-like enzyme